MRWIFAIALLVGCTEEEAWMQAELGDASFFLVDDAEAQFPDRAKVAVRGDARLAPDLPAFEGDKMPIWKNLVVVDPGPEIRVVYDTGVLQLLIYLPRHDLQDVLWKPTLATSGPDGGESGVVLPGGLTIDTADADGGGFYFHVENERVAVDAWVPEEAVDQWWTEPHKPAIAAQYQHDLYLAGDTEILDAPFGTAFAWIQPFTDEHPTTPWVSAEATGRADAGHLEVVVDADGWEVRGWVLEQTQLGGGGKGSGGCCCGFGTGWSFGASHVLPVGTPLYAEPWGRQVARVAHRPWPAFSDSDAPFEINESTPWGVVTLWADPADIVPHEPR